MDRLKSNLLKSYDNNIRPENLTKVTNCKISMTLMHLGLDEKQRVLKIHSQMLMEWIDSKLIWDNKTTGVESLHFSSDEVTTRYILTDK